MDIKVATVSQINGYIKKIIDHNTILNQIWIKGEISNFKHHYSGHMYITLKDENSVLKAVMFRNETKGLAFAPSDGMKVLARGRISVYETGGQYQLYIEEMIPDGVGELYIAYEQLKKRLEQEGLFDLAHKKTIPSFPERVGVVTATTGAAVRDIINVISRRYPYAEIIICPAQVQGHKASESISSAIEYFNKTNTADVLIVGRGGGSIEDLWAFNEEITARAIYNSNIPIISAVGHETDFTIADFVADMRAPTPSAAAEIAVPSQIELRSRISNYESGMYNAVLQGLRDRRIRVQNAKLQDMNTVIKDHSQELDHISRVMEQEYRFRLMDFKKLLSQLCGKLDALSPLSVMARGYAIPIEHDGSVIKSVTKMESGKEFLLKLHDGSKECIVK